jgi:hypothetical protein
MVGGQVSVQSGVVQQHVGLQGDRDTRGPAATPRPSMAGITVLAQTTSTEPAILNVVQYMVVGQHGNIVAVQSHVARVFRPPLENVSTLFPSVAVAFVPVPTEQLVTVLHLVQVAPDPVFQRVCTSTVHSAPPTVMGLA